MLNRLTGTPRHNGSFGPDCCATESLVRGAVAQAAPAAWCSSADPRRHPDRRLTQGSRAARHQAAPQAQRRHRGEEGSLLCALPRPKGRSWARTLHASSFSIRERSSCKVISILGQLGKGLLEAEHPLPRTLRAERTQRGHRCHNQPPARTTALLRRTKAASSHPLGYPRHDSFGVRGGSPSRRKADSSMGTGTSHSSVLRPTETPRGLHTAPRHQPRAGPPLLAGHVSSALSWRALFTSNRAALHPPTPPTQPGTCAARFCAQEVGRRRERSPRGRVLPTEDFSRHAELSSIAFTRLSCQEAAPATWEKAARIHFILHKSCSYDFL